MHIKTLDIQHLSTQVYKARPKCVLQHKPKYRYLTPYACMRAYMCVRAYVGAHASVSVCVYACLDNGFDTSGSNSCSDSNHFNGGLRYYINLWVNTDFKH